jgi:hypothetical protein
MPAALSGEQLTTAYLDANVILSNRGPTNRFFNT